MEHSAVASVTTIQTSEHGDADITNTLTTTKMNINDNAKSSASQCAKIKAWLLQGHKLTSLEALKLFGCMRLASRIHDLREQGLHIHKERIQVPSGKYVTQYSIPQ